MKIAKMNKQSNKRFKQLIEYKEENLYEEISYTKISTNTRRKRIHNAKNILVCN